MGLELPPDLKRVIKGWVTFPCKNFVNKTNNNKVVIFISDAEEWRSRTEQQKIMEMWQQKPWINQEPSDLLSRVLSL